MGNEDDDAIYRREVSHAEAACRICYEGQDQGVMFRPCLCAGTMAYVHVNCLERWRVSGARHSEFVCPNCHYRYNLQSFNSAGRLAQPWVVPFLTFVLFLLCLVTTSLLGVVLISVFGSTDADSTIDLWNVLLYGLIIFASVGGVFSLCVDQTTHHLPHLRLGDDTASKVLIALFLIYGLIRGVFGIYSLISAYAVRTRNSLQTYVQDIRDVPNLGPQNCRIIARL
jgi:E3 ubiquitin-protein ligase DOA10